METVGAIISEPETEPPELEPVAGKVSLGLWELGPVGDEATFEDADCEADTTLDALECDEPGFSVVPLGDEESLEGTVLPFEDVGNAESVGD